MLDWQTGLLLCLPLHLCCSRKTLVYLILTPARPPAMLTNCSACPCITAAAARHWCTSSSHLLVLLLCSHFVLCSPLHLCCSRKTLVYLILTLNHIYPDYDFSLLRA